MKERIFYLITGIVIGCLLLLSFKKTEIIEYKIPVKFKRIEKKIVVVEDKKLKKNFERIIDSLKMELKKAEEKKEFNFNDWFYEDKHLKAWIKYFGLLKEFDYEIKERDTVITYRVKKENFYKNFLFGMVAGGIIVYFLKK